MSRSRFLDFYSHPNDTGIGEFGCLSLEDGRRYFVPLSSSRVAAAALALYRPQPLKARLLHAALRTGLRLGVAQPFLSKTTFTAPHDPIPGADHLLFDHLRRILNNPELQFAITLGTLGPQRKPVLLAMTPDGVSIAFVKVAWSEVTGRLVASENRALEFLSAQQLRWGRFPKVLYFGEWRGYPMLLVEPLALSPTCQDLALTELHLNFLIELAQIQITWQPFMDSDFFRQLLARYKQIEPLVPVYQWRVLEDAMERLYAWSGAGCVPWVWRTGDFAPWNISVNPLDRQVYAIDLEYAEGGSLPGWDLFHFFRAAPQGEIRYLRLLQDNHSHLAAYCAALSLDHEHIPYLSLAYLLDLYTMERQICKDSPDVPWDTPWFRAQSRLIALAARQVRRTTAIGARPNPVVDRVASELQEVGSTVSS
jgi:hypothetical protein